MSDESVSKKPNITAGEKSESPVSESQDVHVLPQTDQAPSTVSPNVTESHATIEGEGGVPDDKNKIETDANSIPEEKRLNSMHDMVLLSIEDCDLSEKASATEHVVPAVIDNRQPLLPNNNNCMALIPIPASGQLVPVALLGKSSGCQDECPGGIMQLITGTNNKVAPAANPDSVQTVGAVLMIIPKKSESVCVDLQQQDEQNNSFQENQNCACNTTAGNVLVDNAVPEPDSALRPSQSYDSYEDVCRICHDNPSKLELISPCLCKGSMSKVHRTCLERWLGESAKNSCEICGYEYNTVRKPKYKGCRSIYQWIRHPLSVSDSRNLLFDIACFFVLTPLSLISSWLCVMGAQHYSLGEEQKRKLKLVVVEPASSQHMRPGMRDASNATWTSVGLLSLTGTLLAAYYIWLFVAVRYHVQIWREWQQRNFTVTIVPFEDGCMGRPPPSRATADQTAEASSTSENPNFGPNSANNNINIPLLYSSGSGTRGRVYGRTARFSGNVNVPAIFSRSHFLRNAHPGYTISETTLMYQAIYGSDSDNALFNDNLLAFIADSSEDMLHEHDTESSEILLEAMRQQQPETKEIEQQCPTPNIVRESPSKTIIISGVGRNDDNAIDIPLGTHVEVVDLANMNVSSGPIIQSRDQQDITNDNTSTPPTVPQESNPNHVTIIVEDDPSKDRGVV
ncbi:E3 ubiquitin-protein ligase MARCH3 [Orchesella cincta]|uniref:E3 ubiquitin-protein ligase MARCH3 n=1 Tax=Orchesella cincta TaxID=48709 RepID=A0A1D2N7Y7_ORCCI|nr:E3 ubiquitin-protein ligase MARCH3 [Orchesella cincta]